MGTRLSWRQRRLAWLVTIVATIDRSVFWGFQAMSGADLGLEAFLDASCGTTTGGKGLHLQVSTRTYLNDEMSFSESPRRRILDELPKRCDGPE